MAVVDFVELVHACELILLVIVLAILIDETIGDVALHVVEVGLFRLLVLLLSESGQA